MNTQSITAPRRRGRPTHAALAFDVQSVPKGANELAVWQRLSGASLDAQGIGSLSGTVGVTVLVGLPRDDLTVQDVAQELLALLFKRGTIDPQRVVEVFARWDNCIPAGRVHAEVRQVAPPERRVGIDGRRKIAERQRARWGTA